MREKVLVFAPHNDDEVLGVGGTLLHFAKQGHEVCVCEVTSGSDRERVDLIKREAAQAHEILGVSQTVFMDLPVVRLNELPKPEINSHFCRIVEEIAPTIVFLPHPGDMHMDHRIVTDAAMVALRPLNAPQVHTICTYETLSETEWNIPNAVNAFVPNAWVDISEELCGKIRAMECYQTQLRPFPHPRSVEAIKALAALRGSTIGVPAAEAFMVIRKIVR